VILAGVVFLDHTADVGMDVHAHSFQELLHRAALGMLALLRGEDDEEPEGSDEAAAGTTGPADLGADPAGVDDSSQPATVTVRVQADSTAALLADWLREILFLHELSRVDYAGASFHVAEVMGGAGQGRIDADVQVRRGGRAVREIKGVTYHELEVARRPDGGWRARVIFDV